jgi:type III restriction enzyme
MEGKKMQDNYFFKTEDLILKVNNNYDHNYLNIEDWEDYIDCLCGNRYYQSEAIKNCIIYFASGKYNSIEDIVSENYAKNYVLKEKYSSLDNYLDNLQIKNKLIANIDLATGTGKSYVIFGVVQIMLGLGLVDKVLVLCPSTTIESGLYDKFIELMSNSNLQNLVPDSAVIRNPHLTNGNYTVKTGDICIENIHAIYENTGSSIESSFKNSQQNVLVINDESHHIYNSSSDKEIKKWKGFLVNPEYNFKYILGLTGTAYIENDYFNDVIYRYSLRKAVDEKTVKDINYAIKDDTSTTKEKFQKIYQNHLRNKERYSLIKPITIFVCANISNATNLKEDLIDYLVEETGSNINLIEEKVLLITSKSSIEEKTTLKNVDDINNSVEWIISVSMLTEGWDVKNVMQIVPWEDRAFNSKLLISQVLGRGLRIPSQYYNNIPSVKVFNHVSWSKNIINLVSEVLEYETKLESSILENGDRSKYNFIVKNINYDKKEVEIEKDAKSTTLDYSNIVKNGIKLESQSLEVEKGTTFQSIYNSKDINEINYVIKRECYTVDEVVDKIVQEFSARDWEGKILKLGEDQYTQNNLPDRKIIKKIIIDSMEKVGITDNFLTEKNRNHVLTTFGTLLRKKNKTVVPISNNMNVFDVNTKDIQNQHISISSLRKETSVFYTDDYENELINDNLKILSEFLEDDSRPVKSTKNKNSYIFKTPMNIVFATGKPEVDFIDYLCKSDVANCIDSWIKSRDIGFYSIEYSWKKNSHQIKNQLFNPDFFIKMHKGKKVFYLVIEIKSDGDDCEENKAKYKYALEHFDNLNEIINEIGEEEEYIFHFLSPNAYPEFFDYIKNQKILDGQHKFRCELENMLEE